MHTFAIAHDFLGEFQTNVVQRSLERCQIAVGRGY
jgi:hypothetical protein